MSFWSHGWAPRKTAAQRRADAARAIAKAARRGKKMTPIVIEGRKIAHTFWGKAWCDNLERYQDFAYRLDRGRSYVRSGSVIDLSIMAGKVSATVSGSDLYTVTVEIDALARPDWAALRRDCAASIGSRLDLLGGKLSESVIVRLCADRTGMFPAPSALRFSCSCPDYASMCKHVAAVMYGVGARLDQAPELFFTLRQVSADELHAAALSEVRSTPASSRVLAAEGLASVFGIELAEPQPALAPPTTSRKSPAAKVAAPKASRGPASAKRSAPKPSRTGARATQGAPAPARVRATSSVARAVETSAASKSSLERGGTRAGRKRAAAKRSRPRRP